VKEFQDIGCEVAAVSVDSKFTHLAWFDRTWPPNANLHLMQGQHSSQGRWARSDEDPSHFRYVKVA
jgi:hypothetical protein